MTAEEKKTDTPTTQTEAPSSQPKVSEERQANCLACGKPIKKLKRYYRDGKFYCSKKCWRQKIAKDKEAKK